MKNVDQWCTVTVGTNTAFSGSQESYCVADGTVDLSAKPLSSTFELGPDPWHDTSGDHGSGDPGTVANGSSSTTVVVSGSGDACVWVCCPFADGSGCPTTNQCP